MNNVFEKRSDGFWYAPPKDPRDTLDFNIDLTGLMEGDASDSITDLQVTIVDPANGLQLQRQIIQGRLMALWFSGGVLSTTPDTVPLVNFLVTTANGRVIDREFRIEIKDL